MLVEQEAAAPEVTYANGNEYGEDSVNEKELPEGMRAKEPAPEKDDWTVENAEYAVSTQSNDELSQPEQVVSSSERSPVGRLVQSLMSRFFLY